MTAAVLANLPGAHGFLGTRGSFMLDVVFVAMLIVVPVMAISIGLVRYRQSYRWHKRLQLSLAILLLVAVAAFEVEVRIAGWADRARASPYWVDGTWNDPIDYSLAVHLLFAIPTPLLWAVVIVQAVRRFPAPPAPGAHSRQHSVWGRAAAAGMLLTALTGWIFYWLAFAS